MEVPEYLSVSTDASKPRLIDVVDPKVVNRRSNAVVIIQSCCAI